MNFKSTTNMYKNFLVILALPFLMSACTKTTNQCNTTGVPTAAELSVLKSNLAAKSITAIKSPAGFYYEIISQGTGAVPTSNSTVRVRYTGKLFNNSIFDTNTTYDGAKLKLSSLISGWQKGLKLINVGGEINLYLPPTLGYGCTAQSSIPANSNLIFNIQLLEVL